MKRRLTINDIAQRAGVSRQTVSRVLNNKDDVSPATRDHVLRIIQELGYQPSFTARSMITRMTNMIALMLPDIANPFFAEIVKGVEHTLSAKGRNVFLFVTNESVERELTCIQVAKQYNVDGIILCSPRIDDANLRKLITDLPPVTLLNRRLNADGVYSVVVDAIQGSYDATSYLLSNGHERIGIIVGPPRSLSGVNRLAGYKKALMDHNRPILEEFIIEVLNVDLDLRKIAKQFIKNEVTAVLAYNDIIAANFMQTCHDLDIQVPEQLSVIGFDGVPISKLISPRLTTMEVPLFEIGVTLAETMIQAIEGKEPLQPNISVYPILRTADSTRPR